MEIRLDKFLSDQKNLPRKDCRKLVWSGAVTVDGEIERGIDRKVDPEKNIIALKGEEISYKKFVYIMLNKPKGVLSAATDKKRETVVDLVPEGLRRKNLFPVGRLDKDTTGLLIITDDGDFAHEIISPKSGISKRYSVLLDGELPKDAEKRFKDGIVLADGTECLPASLFPSSDNPCLCEVEIFEGKYHQIKRMFGVLDLGVVELKRLSIGGLVLPENLPEGDCLELNSTDLGKIHKKHKKN